MSNILGGVMVPHPPLAIPEVGRGNEEKIGDTINAYHEVSKLIGELKPDTIILISPHSESTYNSFNIFSGESESGDFGGFGARNVKFNVNYDTEFYDKLVEISDIPIKEIKSSSLDHGVMVPLYFLNQEYSDYKIVRISLSGLSLLKHYEYGMLLKKVCSSFNKKFFVIASGDLSHRLKDDGPYGFHENGPMYDSLIMEDMEDGNFLNILDYPDTFLDNAAICGHRGFCIMGGILDRLSIDCKKYSYEGPYGVGYGICSYIVNGYDDERCFLDIWKDNKKGEILCNEEDSYISLARKTINTYIREGKILDESEIEDEELLNNRAGVFVSIHKEGGLRGCIGTIMPIRKNIGVEIINNAISAATQDPRFSPITEDELDYLEISVDVLGDAEAVNDISELDVKKYGIIVSFEGKRGLLLPNLDNVNTVSEQISIALRKGNIDESSNYTIERFEVVRHE